MVKTLVEWSKAIRERDKKCLHCGVDQDLHAHHVLPKHSHPDLRLELSNGITLCYRCHKKEHERKRPVRVRSENPRKTTMQRKMDELQKRISVFEERLNGKKPRLNDNDRKLVDAL